MASGADADEAKAWPHPLQKRADGLAEALQTGQDLLNSTPQALQRLAVSRFSALQAGHIWDKGTS